MITTLVTRFIATIRDFDRSAFALSAGLGPWLTPLAPALVFGHTFYASTLDALGRWAIIGGVAMSIGLVVAGATSSHTAMALKSAGAPLDKVRGCWALVISYIVLEITGILTMPHYAGLTVVGVTASLLTLVVYLSRSYRNFLDDFKARTEVAKEAAKEESEEAKEEKQIKLDFQIEQARLNAEHQRQMTVRDADLKHAEKLARIEAKAVQTSVPISVPQLSQQVSQVKSLETLKPDILTELGQETPNLTQLASRLNVGRSTLYRHLGTLVEQGEVIKNGNGYEPVLPTSLNK